MGESTDKPRSNNKHESISPAADASPCCAGQTTPKAWIGSEEVWVCESELVKMRFRLHVELRGVEWRGVMLLRPFPSLEAPSLFSSKLQHQPNRIAIPPSRTNQG